MNVTELLAWVAVGLCVAGVAWAVTDSFIEGRRVTDLEATLDDALRALDDAVVRISHLEDAATMPRQAAESPPEPSTAPIRLPVPARAATWRTGARTDTDHSHTVIGREHLALAGQPAGRHRAP